MSTDSAPLAGSFSSHSGGESESPKKPRSVLVNQEERMDQIMKVDTQALLKTIVDLEKRLNEHQRQDSIPPWAQALQTRMEQLEKMRSSAPSAEEQAAAPKQESVNLSTLTMEERIISKIRNEFETKIGNSQLHFEGIISSYSLEMERLHKLLIIRPTTSELQQVVLNVQQQDQRTQQHIQEMQNLMMASLRDRISEEMVGCLLELRNARAAGEESSRLIAKQVADFTAQMGELREGAQNSIIALQEAQTESKALMEAQKGDIEQSRRLLKDEIYKVNAITLALKNDVKSTGELLTEQTARIDDSIAKLDDRIKAENKRLEKEVKDILPKIEEVEKAQVEAESTLSQVKFNFEREMDDLREWRKTLDKKFQDTEKRQMLSEKQINELIAQDFGSQIKKSSEHADKLALELEELKALCHHTLTADIKSNALKISLLQEQCNIAIPKTLNEHARRTADLHENLRTVSESIEVLKGRHDQEDELIASLLPLNDKVAFLADAKTAHDTELENLKEGITACMDGNSEFARRLEEFEESLETFDESINSRMNRIRDTLLDTLMDKQGEATAHIRHNRENLEVMSMAAGEAGMSVVAGGGMMGSGGGMAGGGKNKGPMANAAVGGRMTVVHRETDGPANAMMQGPAGVNAGQMQRLASFRRPTINGAVVQGTAAGGSPSNNGGPPQHHQQQQQQGGHPGQPTPMLGAAPASGTAALLKRGGSIRMQHQTQNILAQHRKVVGMAAHAEGGQDNSSVVPAPQGSPTGNHQGQNMPGNSESSTIATNTGRSSMLSARSQNMVHIPQPQAMDPNGAPSSPDPQNYIPPPMSSAHPEGDHPAIELSPGSKTAHPMDFAQDMAEEAYYDQPGDQQQQQQHFQQPNQQQQQQQYYQQQLDQRQQYYQQQPNQQSYNNQNHGYDNGSIGSGFAAPSVPVPVPVGTRSDVITGEYNQLVTGHGAMDEANVEHEAQFLADLCLNFEDISLKRKKVSALPLAFCQSIAQITKAMAELIAEQADFEMVEQAIAAVNAPLVVQDVNYDETFVVNTRQRKQDEYIELVLRYVNGQISNGGVIRSDARQLFMALTRKALDMFMSKHNQVLVAGNSRLGRVKIPSCIACDRPLVEKSRLDRAVASPQPGTRGLMEQSAATLRSGWSNPGGGGSQVFTDEDPASQESVQRAYPAVHLENSHTSSSAHVPAKGILGRGLLTASMDSQRPKTMSTGNRAPSSGGHNSNNNAKVLKSSTMRPNSSALL